MSKLVKQATNELHTLIVDALGKAVSEGEIPAEPIPAFNIEVPANRDNGDYSSNIAFVCAKVLDNTPWWEYLCFSIRLVSYHELPCYQALWCIEPTKNNNLQAPPEYAPLILIFWYIHKLCH